jgi:hypothetical protein
MVSTSSNARMTGPIDGPSHGRNVRRHASRCLVVHDSDGLVAVRLVFPEPGLEQIGVDAGPPVSLDDVRLETEGFGHLAPQRREPTGLEHQQPVAGRQRVDESGFPSAGSGGRINHDRIGRLENRSYAREHFEAKLGELRSAVIDRRFRDRR